MFWEYSPGSANIASDWLRSKSSPADEEEIKIKVDDGVDTSLASDGICLFVDLGRCSLISETRNDTVVS